MHPLEFVDMHGWQIQRANFSKGDMLIESGACKKSLFITNGGR